jgi:hypothetical protein
MTIQRTLLGFIQTLPKGEIFTIESCAQEFSDFTEKQVASALALMARNHAELPYKRISHGVYQRTEASTENAVPPSRPKIVEDKKPSVAFLGTLKDGSPLVSVDGVIGKVEFL